jgi:hypothetical protein
MMSPTPRPANRSFADPSCNILGSKLCATICPKIFRFILFKIVFDFFFLLLSSYSSPTILRFLIPFFLYFKLLVLQTS